MIDWGRVFTAENMTLLVLLVISVTIHELSHGLVAYALGDPTGKQAGRLTLNPLKHLDPWLSFVMPVVMMISMPGGMWFAGAKPMPVQTDYLRSPRRDLALVAAAGPLSNWLQALFSLLLCLPLLHFGAIAKDGFWNGVIFKFAMLNLFLVVLNLLPVPPLDGYKIIRIFLPRPIANWLDRLDFMGILLVMVLMLTPYGSGLLMKARDALVPTVAWLLIPLN